MIFLVKVEELTDSNIHKKNIITTVTTSNDVRGLAIHNDKTKST